MAHRRTESRDEVAEMVSRYNGSVSFGMGGKHQIAEITVGEKMARMFFSCTPSDRNAHKCAARQARKILINLGAKPNVSA
jgi:hypothetical protein